VFLLAKSAKYFYDADAIAERSIYPGDARHLRLDVRKLTEPLTIDKGSRARTGNPNGEYRNKRTVWTFATLPTPEAHFATFTIELAETCILAGCPVDGTVLDPFSGAGTTGLAALKNGRRYLGIELNPAYIDISFTRARKYYPLLLDEEVSA
jgi:DNA modification methylase